MKYDILTTSKSNISDLSDFLKSLNDRVVFVSNNLMVLASLRSDISKFDRKLDIHHTIVKEGGLTTVAVSPSGEEFTVETYESFHYVDIHISTESSTIFNLTEIDKPHLEIPIGDNVEQPIIQKSKASKLIERIKTTLKSHNVVFIEEFDRELEDLIVSDSSFLNFPTTDYFKFVQQGTAVIKCDPPTRGTVEYTKTVSNIVDGLNRGSSFVCLTSWMQFFMELSYDIDVSFSSAVVFKAVPKFNQSDLENLFTVES